MTASLHEQCKKDSALWLQITSYMVSEYIVQVEETDNLHKILAEKPDLNEGDKIDEEIPEKRSSAGSLRILQSLISLLHNKPQEISSFDDQPAPRDEFLTQNMSKIWSMTLNLLRTVQLNELVEAKLLEQLIEAFLMSSEKIKQTTYM